MRWLWLALLGTGLFSFTGGMLYSDLYWLELLSDPAFACEPVVDAP